MVLIDTKLINIQSNIRNSTEYIHYSYKKSVMTD